MHNITINGNKRAIISHMRQTYQNENNADVLRFMMVPEFNGLSIKDDCLVMWTISNEDESLIIDTGQITWKDELIDGYLVSEILINSTVTQVPGELKIRIKILSTNNNMVAKTNPCSFSVEKHPDSAETLPEGSLTLLNQWQIDMTNLRDEMTVSLTEIRQISDDVSDAKTEVNENLIMVKDLKQVVSEKHTEVIDSADRVYNALDETNQSKEAAQQALQDLLAMLGSDVATLVNGKIPMSQIPATATQEIYTVTSEEELTSLSAQRGDLAELIEISEDNKRTVVKTWQKLSNDEVAIDNSWYFYNPGNQNIYLSGVKSGGVELIVSDKASPSFISLKPFDISTATGKSFYTFDVQFKDDESINASIYAVNAEFDLTDINVYNQITDVLYRSLDANVTTITIEVDNSIETGSSVTIKKSDAEDVIQTYPYKIGGICFSKGRNSQTFKVRNVSFASDTISKTYIFEPNSIQYDNDTTRVFLGNEVYSSWVVWGTSYAVQAGNSCMFSPIKGRLFL